MLAREVNHHQKVFITHSVILRRIATIFSIIATSKFLGRFSYTSVCKYLLGKYLHGDLAGQFMFPTRDFKCGTRGRSFTISLIVWSYGRIVALSYRNRKTLSESCFCQHFNDLYTVWPTGILHLHTSQSKFCTVHLLTCSVYNSDIETKCFCLIKCPFISIR